MAPPELEAHGAALAVARLLLLRELLRAAPAERSASGATAGEPAAREPAPKQPAGDATGPALFELALGACGSALHSGEALVRHAAVDLLLLLHGRPGSAQRVERWLKDDPKRLESLSGLPEHAAGN